jgi:hypothetical protein
VPVFRNPTLRSRAHVQLSKGPEADPNVNKYAALDLAAAKGDLCVAEEAASHHNEAQIEQSAYLAAQKSAHC